MMLCSENPWIAAGTLMASIVLGSLPGCLLIHRTSGNGCGEMKKTSMKAAGCAAMTGGFFTLTVLLRGNIGVSALRDFGLSVILLRVSLCDLRHYEIPEKALLGGVLLWPLWLFFGGLSEEFHAWSAFCDGALSAALFSLVLLILTLIAEKLVRKEILGGGDIKLIFMVMLHLGFLCGLICLVIAILSGLVFVTTGRQRRFPFGPSVAIGTLSALLLDSIFWG